MKTVYAGCLGFSAALVLLVIVLAISPDPKNASPTSAETASLSQKTDAVNFDPQEDVHKAQLDQMEANAGACMERGMHGMLMQGIRSREQLLGFAQNTCGSGLKRFLVSLGMPETAADAYVRKTAEDVLAVELQ